MIADQQQIMSESLGLLFAKEEDIEVIATVKNGFTVVEKCIELLPDIIFIDVNLSGISGIVVTGMIKKHYPLIKVVILTDVEDRQTILDALNHGADAYILKTITPEELIRLVRDLNRKKD